MGELDGQGNLPGGPGRDHLDAALFNMPPGQVPSFLATFRAANSLDSPGVDAPLSLLEMGGVKRHRVHESVLFALKDKLLDRIAAASRRRGERDLTVLADLFEATFVYINIPEMLPIVTAVMVAVAEEETVFQPHHWRMIHSAGYDRNRPLPPYFALPTVLKARMWELFPASFEREVTLVLKRVVDYDPPARHEDVFLATHGGKEDLLDELTRLVKYARNVDAVGTIVDTFVQHCSGAEVRENECVAVADLLLEFLAQPTLKPGSTAFPHLHLTPALADMAQAARIVVTRATAAGGDLNIGELNTLNYWLKGSPGRPATAKIMALLVHSSHARALFAARLVERLCRGHVRGASVEERVDSDPFVRELTSLTMSSMHAKGILASGQPLRDAAWQAPYQTFYPRLAVEIRRDAEWARDARHVCVELPHPELRSAARSSAFTRRVFSTYCYSLAAPGEGGVHRSRLSRMRLVLDDILGIVDDGLLRVEGEEREQVLCSYLIDVAIDDGDE
jgi:hypothetical protein